MSPIVRLATIAIALSVLCGTLTGSAHAAAALSISATAPASSPYADAFAVPVTVTNAGDAVAHAVNLQATPAANESQLGYSGATCLGDGMGHENCDLGSLAPGASATVTFMFEPVLSSGTLHNSFMATSTDTAPVSASTDTTIQPPPPPPPRPDVTVTMASASSVPEGRTLTTTDTIRNNGPGALDVLDVSHLNDLNNEVIISASAPCVAGWQTTCHFGPLAVGQTITVTVVSSVLWGTANASASESVSVDFGYGGQFVATATGSRATPITLGTPIVPPFPVNVIGSSTSPPVSVILPSFAGGDYFGQPLQIVSLGTWRAVLPEFHWRWLGCDPDGTNCGTGDNRLDLTPSIVPSWSVGRRLTLEVGAQDAYGSWTWADAVPGPVVTAFPVSPTASPAPTVTTTTTPSVPTPRPTSASVQSPRGALAGWVHDARGRAVGGALARLTSSGRTTSVRTNARGGFLFSKRLAGAYRLVVTRTGYRAVTRHVRVAGQTTVRVVIVLRPV